jgi:pilus assembly protein Flp/PilA
MHRFTSCLSRFLKAQDGPTTVEYAVLLALVVGLCASAVAPIGPVVANMFNNPTLNAAAGSGS